MDEDEEIEDRRRHHRGKRSRPREEEHLDEDDLELIGEHVPGLSRGSASEVCDSSTIEHATLMGGMERRGAPWYIY